MYVYIYISVHITYISRRLPPRKVGDSHFTGFSGRSAKPGAHSQGAADPGDPVGAFAVKPPMLELKTTTLNTRDVLGALAGKLPLLRAK